MSEELAVIPKNGPSAKHTTKRACCVHLLSDVSLPVRRATATHFAVVLLVLFVLSLLCVAWKCEVAVAARDADVWGPDDDDLSAVAGRHLI